MKATIKTDKGKVFTGELVEECKGFERIIGNIRVSATHSSGTANYPIRISILDDANYGKETGTDEGCDNIPGDLLDRVDVRKVIKALNDALDYYEENK